MATPLFNDAAIFGVDGTQVMSVEPYPPRLQREFYPDVNGAMVVMHGGSGGSCVATFVQVATDTVTLTAYEATLYNLVRACQPYTLRDTLDRDWPRARMVGFRSTGPVRVEYTADGPVYSRPYEARFEIPDMQ